MMAFMGVRRSWEMLKRKADLAWLRSSARIISISRLRSRARMVRKMP